ncbi:MAG: hypothetical protein NC218_10560 [Acetobacter sp.]|nr:hypothetical protein [Acetobacter sp.]
MCREYADKLVFVKARIIHYLKEIFKVYGNELLLRLEDCNLLQDECNCIETSTATGFILEEFITTKLEVYTQGHEGRGEIRIRKISSSTVNSSYDCYAEYEGILVMINIKIQKATSSNNAVAAINILHNDYVLTEPEREKAYFILKTYYSFENSLRDGERKIRIQDVNGYFLEEFDFSLGHRQDHRNWSENFNANAGRLQVSAAWAREHRMAAEEISYERTKAFIQQIYQRNRA